MLVMQIRTYRPADEEGIVKVINSSFETFRRWGLTPEKWLGYVMDPGFRTENALVAEDEGKIVGHVQLIDRSVNLRKFVRVSGIANVCTDPDARGKGVATKLMSEAMRISAGFANISALGTGFGTTPHRIYRRVGFSPFHFFRLYVGEKWDAERSVSYLQSLTSLVGDVRPFQPGDEVTIKRIYEESAYATSGFCQRTEKYWTEKMFKRISWLTPFYRDFEPEDVLVLPGRGYAYLNWENEHKRLEITEALSRRGDLEALAAIYGAALKKCKDCEQVLIWAPEGDENVELALSHLYAIREAGSFMISVLNPAGLIEEIGGLDGGVALKRAELRLYNDIDQLRPAVVSLKDFKPTEGAPDVKITMHQVSFVRMLAGLDDPLDLVLKGKIEIAGDSSNVALSLRSLFQPRPFIVWPADEW